MALLATLVAKIEARSDGLQKELEKANAALEKLTKTAEKTEKSAAVAAAAAVASIAKYAKDAGVWLKDLAMQEANVIVTQYKFARSIGDSVANVLELQSAIRQLGGDAEDINAALMTLGKTISRSLSDSATANIFKRLSLDIEQLQRMKPSESFIAIAEAISRIQNPQEKAALATQLFGDKAAALLPLLNKGAAGIAELRDRAREFGQTANDMEADKIEQMVDKLDILQQRLEGLGKQLAIQAATRGWMEGIQEYFELLQSYVTSGLLYVVTAFVAAFAKISRMTADLLPKGSFKDAANRSADDAYSIVDSLKGDIAGEEKTREEIRGRANKRAELPPAIAPPIARTKERTANGATKFAQFDAERYQRGLAIFKEMQTPVEKFNDKLNDLNLLLQSGAVDWETYGRAGAKALNELSESMGDKQINFAGATGRDSTAAYSAQIRNEAKGEMYREDPAKRMERLQNQAIELQKQQLEQQKKTADALQNRDKAVRI